MCSFCAFFLPLSRPAHCGSPYLEHSGVRARFYVLVAQLPPSSGGDGSGGDFCLFQNERPLQGRKARTRRDKPFRSRPNASVGSLATEYYSKKEEEEIKAAKVMMARIAASKTRPTSWTRESRRRTGSSLQNLPSFFLPLNPPLWIVVVVLVGRAHQACPARSLQQQLCSTVPRSS